MRLLDGRSRIRRGQSLCPRIILASAARPDEDLAVRREIETSEYLTIIRNRGGQASGMKIGRRSKPYVANTLARLDPRNRLAGLRPCQAADERIPEKHPELGRALRAGGAHTCPNHQPRARERDQINALAHSNSPFADPSQTHHQRRL